MLGRIHSAVLVAISITGIAAAAERPNVILIMTDDQGYGDLSCHGNPVLSTPHLDKLASESVRLTDFHVAPMCTPTRGQLLSGYDAFRNGAMNVSSGRTLLRPELLTMADLFRSAGYRTGIFGKWHLGDNYPFRPSDRGFDESLWFPSSHINAVPDYWDNDYFDDTYIHNDELEQYSGYCTDLFFGKAMDWIEQEDSEQPFFAYIPLNAAHWPHFVPDRFRAGIRKSLEEHPEVVEHLADAGRAELVSFLAMIANIDENFGNMDRFLDEKDLFDNTIVIFLTDNGSTMGEKYFNAGMRGRKTQLWEGGHRVPCFLRWPGGGLTSRDVDGLTQVQDLLPTLMDLANISEIPDDLDGISLASALRGETEVPDRMLVINYSRMPQFQEKYTETPHIPAREGAAVLWGNWRLLEDRELYNLAEDPHQDHDVAAEHPEVVSQMRSSLNDWWDGVKDNVLEPQRVIIGSDHENPSKLTACEWLDVFVDQQKQIRQGTLANGAWHLTVDQPGNYTFKLRRWPRESGLKLAETVPQTEVTDGTYVKGNALPIHSGRIRIGGIEKSGMPDPDGQSLTFQLPLEAGQTELQTWLLNESGEPICGAYYVYVERLTE